MSNLNPSQFGVPVPEGTRIRISGGMGHMAGDSSRSITKMVPISTVKRYMEYDRLGRHNTGDSQARVRAIADELKAGGVIKEPLMLEHSTKHQWGYLGEGHHRLLAAEQAGHTHVPVFVYSGSSGYGPGERKKQGIGAPLTLDRTNLGNIDPWPVPHDYQPEELHPGHFKELQ